MAKAGGGGSSKVDGKLHAACGIVWAKVLPGGLRAMAHEIPRSACQFVKLAAPSGFALMGDSRSPRWVAGAH